MKLLMKGKVKEVYEIDEDELEFLFTDKISVFDKIVPSQIPFKGETLCRTSAHWFEIVEKMGIKTHYISVTSANRMRVRRVNVIKDYGLINERTTNYLIPLEFICRYYVAGSLFDRIKKGTVKAKELGFSENQKIRYGDKLEQPFFEQTTKLEKVDRLLTKDEALKISGLTEEEYDKIKEKVLSIDEKVHSQVEKRGLIHVDGKKEFAFDPSRNLMIIDTFGTADEDRFWDKEKYELGEYVELSKEYVRQYYRTTNYFDRLSYAREHRLEEPEIPPLTDDVIEEVSDLYIESFERITGRTFKKNQNPNISPSLFRASLSTF
jgi:phosphoribosylaminoimidazole-succinocarboxamide synthase